MKIHKPVKHARRKAMIAQRKAKGKYSHRDLPKPLVCSYFDCHNCWAYHKNCGIPADRYNWWW